ncbi:hypothetical protein ACIBCN_41690 [Nocardia sp. NPDC051052]|uniref:hypothetical protein n=1 Tax=Nocardia sp. NPDC051052 TaxID=3364322 RepID=UPI003797AB5A
MTLIYLAVGALGLISGTSVCGMMAVDTFGTWVHVIEGIILAGIAAYGVAVDRDSAVRSGANGVAS